MQNEWVRGRKRLVDQPLMDSRKLAELSQEERRLTILKGLLV